ncbi:MAG: M28 family peptidase [Paludibacteraceae bacterium]|nr:M28 family peptidase [Paludibacteraceae bacterium]
MRPIRLLELILSVLFLSLLSCSRAGSSDKSIQAADFSADSAYRYIREQVDFGPRVPGTPAHEQCARYLRDKLTEFGATVRVEQGQLPNYAGEPQQIYNIIGSYAPEAKQRILLCAHWDSRPWCDQEENYDDRMQPVLGANDGASGVGVLLELARQFSIFHFPFSIGIDLVFFDAEDMGTPSFYTGKEREDTWCLGSQLWARQRKKDGTSKAYEFGILLDMVGSPDAVFPKEYYSLQYASPYVEKVWRMASQLGYGRYFRDTRSYPLTDDHYYVCTLAGIPCLDIIHYDAHNGTGFAHYWHTTHDDMQNISKTTLDAVGRTLMTLIQNEYARNN